MRRTRFFSIALLAILVRTAPAGAQARAPGPALKPFISVDAPIVAIVHATLVDGTGRPAQSDQTIVIQGERIGAVGPTAGTAVPEGAQVIDATNKSVIPGIIGLHDHMYYGGMRFMGATYPRLFLSAGVTTIRTTGSVDAYQELNLKRQIDSLTLPGPDIVVTGPYLQGAPNQLNAMHPLSGPDDARRMVRYWAEEGVTWFKAYTTISRAELGAAIDEAHKHGVKVTAHLCSVGFREAVALGIDQLEHGFLTDYEFYGAKQPDKCPTGPGSDSAFMLADINGPDVQRTIREMVAHHVALTSTLDVFELSVPARLVPDQRVLDAVHPDVRPSINSFYELGAKVAGTAQDTLHRRMYRNAMAFERAFASAGGLLGAGSDPCCGPVIAGYGDQRNYELLIEAGFSPEQALQVMTSNGAKILGFDKRVGTIAPGMQADLVLLTGDVVRTPGSIRNTEIVFRRGIGFDAGKLRESVKGRIGM